MVSRKLMQRALLAAALASWCAGFDVAAQSGVEPDQTSAASVVPLSLDEAIRLALTDQPVLTGREAMVRADEQAAIAAAQLPDPRLSAGIKELPIDSGEAFSPRRDDFTEFTVGLSQDFPRADKRRIKGARKQLDATADRATLENDRRAVRRDAALAWLDVYEAEQALRLSTQLAQEAALQVKAMEKDYGNAAAAQADVLAAQVEAGLASDKTHDGLHHVQRMRAGLARWIGDEALRPLADALPLISPSASLAGLLAMADRHPVVSGIDTQIEAAQTDVALARQSYRPDFSLEGYFAYRQDFADFVGVQLSVDLPTFTRNRQDRTLAAALEQSTASTERKRDLLRTLHAEVSQDYLDRQHYQARAQAFDETIIPDARRRVDAARSAYGAGRGSFDAVLLARRSLLDTQLQRLSLTVEAARAQVRLDYLAPSQPASGDVP